MFRLSGLVKTASISRRRTLLSQTLAGEIDPISVVDDAIEDRVGERWHPDHIVPVVDGDLAGDHDRANIVAILDDFEQIARLIGGERLRAPIVEYEQFGARDRAQEPGVAPVALRDRQIGE